MPNTFYRIDFPTQVGQDFIGKKASKISSMPIETEGKEMSARVLWCAWQR